MLKIYYTFAKVDQFVGKHEPLTAFRAGFAVGGVWRD